MGTIFHGNQPYSGGGVLNIVHKTWAQYQALSEAEKHDAGKYYFVPDAPAQGVPGIVAELQDDVDTINSKIGAFGEYVEVSIASGTETRGSLLSRLMTLVDTAKVTPRACLQFISSTGQVYTFPLTTIASGVMYFSAVTGVGAPNSNLLQISTGANAYWRQCTIAATTHSATDYISYNDIAGTIMRFYY